MQQDNVGQTNARLDAIMNAARAAGLLDERPRDDATTRPEGARPGSCETPPTPDAERSADAEDAVEALPDIEIAFASSLEAGKKNKGADESGEAYSAILEDLDDSDLLNGF